MWTSQQEHSASPDSTREPVAPRLPGRGQNVLRRHCMIPRTRLLHSVNLIISLFAASSCRYGSDLKLQKWQNADSFKTSNVHKHWDEQHVSLRSGLKLRDSNPQLNRPQLQSPHSLCLASGLTFHSYFQPLPYQLFHFLRGNNFREVKTSIFHSPKPLFILL